jgi:hypothetical protein
MEREREREREGTRNDKGSEAQNIHRVGCQFMNVSMFVNKYQQHSTQGTLEDVTNKGQTSFLLLIPLSISTKSKSSSKEGIN